MMPDTNPVGGLVVGDVSDLSESTRAYLASLPTSGGPAQVFARFTVAADRADRQEEKRRQERLAALRDRQADLVFQMQRRGEEVPTIRDRMRHFAAVTELEDRAAERHAQSRAEEAAIERAALAEKRLAEAKAELASEQSRSARTAARLGDVTAAALSYRRQARDGSYGRGRDYWR
jgi:hypothetical protein